MRRAWPNVRRVDRGRALEVAGPHRLGPDRIALFDQLDDGLVLLPGPGHDGAGLVVGEPVDDGPILHVLDADEQLVEQRQRLVADELDEQGVEERGVVSVGVVVLASVELGLMGRPQGLDVDLDARPASARTAAGSMINLAPIRSSSVVPRICSNIAAWRAVTAASGTGPAVRPAPPA